MKFKLLLISVLFIPLITFSFYISDRVLDTWTDYGLEYYSYRDNEQLVFKTMYHYAQMGGTVHMYYVPNMANLTLEQPDPPAFRRNSDTELLISFWLHRNGLFSLNEQVIKTYRRIMSEGKKGTAAFRTPYSIVRMDCQNDSDVFFLSLTEQK